MGAPMQIVSITFADVANLVAALLGIACMAAGMMIGRRR
jgi:hypothetical protein